MSKLEKKENKLVDFKRRKGRSRIKITEDDWERMAKMASKFNLPDDIAEIMSISRDTLNRRTLELFGMTFAKWCEKYQAHGRKSLRQAQMVKAVKHLHPGMLMWLGKQYLDQTDKAEVKAEVKNSNSLTDWLHDLDEDEPIDVTPGVTKIEGPVKDSK